MRNRWNILIGIVILLMLITAKSLAAPSNPQVLEISERKITRFTFDIKLTKASSNITYYTSMLYLYAGNTQIYSKQDPELIAASYTGWHTVTFDVPNSIRDQFITQIRANNNKIDLKSDYKVKVGSGSSWPGMMEYNHRYDYKKWWNDPWSVGAKTDMDSGFQTALWTLPSAQMGAALRMDANPSAIEIPYKDRNTPIKVAINLHGNGSYVINKIDDKIDNYRYWAKEKKTTSGTFDVQVDPDYTNSGPTLKDPSYDYEIIPGGRNKVTIAGHIKVWDEESKQSKEASAELVIPIKYTDIVEKEKEQLEKDKENLEEADYKVTFVPDTSYGTVDANGSASRRDWFNKEPKTKIALVLSSNAPLALGPSNDEESFDGERGKPYQYTYKRFFADSWSCNCYTYTIDYADGSKGTGESCDTCYGEPYWHYYTGSGSITHKMRQKWVLDHYRITGPGINTKSEPVNGSHTAYVYIDANIELTQLTAVAVWKLVENRYTESKPLPTATETEYGYHWTQDKPNEEPPSGKFIYKGYSEEYKFDHIDPVISIDDNSYKPNKVGLGWEYRKTTIRIDVSDNLSGFHGPTSRYILSDSSHYQGANLTGLHTKNFQDMALSDTSGMLRMLDGMYNLNVHLEDLPGSIDDEVRDYYIDSTPPKVTINWLENSALNQMAWQNNRWEMICDPDNKITIDMGDNLSGIVDARYAWTKYAQGPDISIMRNMSITQTTEGTMTKVRLDIPVHDTGKEWRQLKSGEWYLHIYIKDRAGNVFRTNGANTNSAAVYPEAMTDAYIKSGMETLERIVTVPRIFINKTGQDGDDSNTGDPGSTTPNLPASETSNLKITKVYDIKWQNTVKPPITSPIYVQDMPAYMNKIPGKIKLGYRVDFELDTVGIGKNNGDAVIISAHQFVNTPVGYREVDIYIPQDKYGSKYVRVTADTTSTGVTAEDKKMKLIRLERNSTSDTGYFSIINPAKEKYNWKYSYYIRPDAKFAIKDASNPAILDISIAAQASKFVNVNQSPEMLIIHNIQTRKNNGTNLFYTLKEDKWSINPNTNFYGTKKTLGVDLLNMVTGVSYGVDKGEVFWYDIQNTIIDDLNKGLK